MYITNIWVCIIFLRLDNALALPKVVLFDRTGLQDSIPNDYPLQQKQYDEYLMGYTTEPEQNFDLSKIPKDLVRNKEAIENVKNILENEGFTKTGVFDLLDYDMRYQTTALYDMFSAVLDWNVLRKVVDYMKNKVHPEQLTYALAVTVYHHPRFIRLAPPNWFEVFPNYLLPATSLRELYKSKMEGKNETLVYVNIANQTVHGKNGYFNPFDDVDEESKLKYFREDMGLSNMFLNWHLHFPTWKNFSASILTESWEDRGHLFYYFHQQLLARYNLERINNRLKPVDRMSWSNVEMSRYIPDLLDNEGVPILGRHTGKPDPHNTWWERIQEMENLEQRIQDVVDSNLVLNKYHHKLEPLKEGHEIYQLGNTLLGTDNSSHPEFYGSYFFGGMDTVSIMGKGDIPEHKEPGLFLKMLTSLRDPMFYQFLENTISYVAQYIYTYMNNYQEIDSLYNYDGLVLDSVDMNNRLTTHFAYEEIDVTRAVDLAAGETIDDVKYRAKVLKLKHRPFSYTINITKYIKPTEVEKTNDLVMFRLFLGPKLDWRGRDFPFSQARQYFIEIDRFPIELVKGHNSIKRSSLNSTVYVNNGALNYAFVEDRVREGKVKKNDWDLSIFNEISYCGFPNDLMLPKGEKHGTPFRLIGLITPFTLGTQNGVVRDFKSFPLCGQPRFMDHWTGFPFDRVAGITEETFRAPFAIHKEITIYHTSRDNK
ncbi:hexamerin-like [Rhodnius prolixus]